MRYNYCSYFFLYVNINMSFAFLLVACFLVVGLVVGIFFLTKYLKNKKSKNKKPSVDPDKINTCFDLGPGSDAIKPRPPKHICEQFNSVPKENISEIELDKGRLQSFDNIGDGIDYILQTCCLVRS